jgi:hypothetical protein
MKQAHTVVIQVSCSLCLLLPLLSPATSGQEATKQGGEHATIPWHKTFESATREATRSGKPILVHFNADREAACNDIVRIHLHDPDVQRSMAQFVCVVASPDIHARVGAAGLCSRFGSLTCKQHQQLWTFASLKASGSPEPTAPQFVFLTSSGAPMFRTVKATSAFEMVGVMERALQEIRSPGSTSGVTDEALRDLGLRTEDSQMSTRRRAIREVARLDDPRALAMLQKLALPEAGEAMRQEAVKAILASKNINALPIVIPLLRDKSGQLRRNAVFVLSDFGLREAVPALLDCYGRETSNRQKALILRTLARMDRHHPEVLRLHRRELDSGGPTMRVHAVRACLDLDVEGSHVKTLIAVAHAGTSLKVQALACYVATEILLKMKKPLVVEAEEGEGATDGYARTVDRPHAQEILAQEASLADVLRAVAEGSRDEKLRAYAASCVDALEGKPSSFRSDILVFHNDKKDEVFRRY